MVYHGAIPMTHDLGNLQVSSLHRSSRALLRRLRLFPMLLLAVVRWWDGHQGLRDIHPPW